MKMEILRSRMLELAQVVKPAIKSQDIAEFARLFESVSPTVDYVTLWLLQYESDYGARAVVATLVTAGAELQLLPGKTECVICVDSTKLDIACEIWSKRRLGNHSMGCILGRAIVDDDAGAIARVADEVKYKKLMPVVYEVAMEHARFNIVDKMQELGCELPPAFRDGTLLRRAIETGDAKSVHYLLQLVPDGNMVDECGDPVIFSALETYDCRIIEDLLQHGADANARRKDGTTLLNYAIRLHFASGVSLLKDYGADVLQADASMDLPVQMACKHDSVACAHLLGIDTPFAGDTPLTAACALYTAAVEGEWGRAKALLDAGVDVNATACSDGLTPLMGAARNNQPVMISLLTHAGADLRKRDAHGKTALMYAAEYGHKRCLKLLLLLEPRDADGHKAFDDVFTTPNAACRKLLQRAGAEVYEEETSPWSSMYPFVDFGTGRSYLIQNLFGKETSPQIGNPTEAPAREEDTPSAKPDSYHSLNDAELVEKLRGHDKLAYKELVRRFSPCMKSLSAEYSGIADNAEPFMLSRLDAILTKSEFLHKYTAEKSSLVTYLYECMRNMINKEIRKYKQERAVLAKMEPPSTNTSHTTSFSRKELRGFLGFLFAALNCNECEIHILKLNICDERSVPHVARLLGVSKKEITNIIRKVMRRINRLFGSRSEAWNAYDCFMRCFPQATVAQLHEWLAIHKRELRKVRCVVDSPKTS